MKSKLRLAITTAVLLSLIIGGSAAALSSTNFRLNWFTPLTSGGGSPISSTNFKVNNTIGQTIIGSASSANYQVGLGFWYGADVCVNCLFLPLILR